MFYMDCYCYGACLGTEFPVNSYCDVSWEALAAAGVALLKDLNSGIDEVRLTRASQGQCPVPLTAMPEPNYRIGGTE